MAKQYKFKVYPNGVKIAGKHQAYTGDYDVEAKGVYIGSAFTNPSAEWTPEEAVGAISIIIAQYCANQLGYKGDIIDQLKTQLGYQMEYLGTHNGYLVTVELGRANTYVFADRFNTDRFDI